ncbi:TRAFs-binding domain-containing protein, partial [Rhizobium leguminosarum]|uniref:TRAFs-binding domain-containing protein n=1 Tax=Rhizobium leguminosarum TaxID=384 RepID=UPI003F94C228
MLPIVKFAVEQKMKTKTPDYWDYATLLEIAVLEKNQLAAKDALKKSIQAIRELWEQKSTINNLQLI